jgi:hypothetical protein
MKRSFFKILFSALIIIPLVMAQAPAESLSTVVSGYNEDYPFELIITENNDTTASLVCFVPGEGLWELIVSSKGTKGYQLITDDTPFVVDLDDEYSICFKRTFKRINSFKAL